MSKSTLAAGVAAVLAFMTAGAALAQQAPTRGARGDTDGDGRISRAEFVDSRIARLTAIDTSRDGAISVEERRSAFQARRAEGVSARFATLDKDGDGAISREEFTAPRETRVDRGGRHGLRQGGHRGGRHGAWGGRGRSGERGPNGEARGPLSIADVQTRLTARFDRLDANQDGFITVEERAAARGALRGQRGERRAERMARRAAGQSPVPASPSTPASE